jgi:hypothetical protein
MNPTLEELRSRASKLTSHEEIEMFAPPAQYMELLKSAVKNELPLIPARNGFKLEFNNVPVYIMPNRLDHASVMEGKADLLS